MEPGDSTEIPVLEFRQSSVWQIAGVVPLAGGVFWLYSYFTNDEFFAQIPLGGFSWPGAVLIALAVILMSWRRYFVVCPDASLVFENRIGPFRSHRVYRADEHFGFFQDRIQQFETDRWGNTSTTVWHAVYFVKSNGKAVTLVRSPDAEDANGVRKRIETYLGREIPRKRYGGKPTAVHS